MNANLHESRTAAAPTPHGRRRRSLWKTPVFTTALIMLFPLLGSVFISGWHWHPAGFVVVAALIFGVCFLYQLVTRQNDTIAYRAAMGIAFAASFSLLWGSLVQFFDVNRAAAMYFGVPIVMIIGAAIARLRPIGMSRAMFATALVQASALSIALIIMLIREPHITFWTLPELRGFAGNAITFILFITSALLFHKAGRPEARPAVV